MHYFLRLYIPFAHLGGWLQSDVLGGFSLGITAKQVLEEELGVFGVLAYILYKVGRLVVDGLYVSRPAWFPSSHLARAGVLCGALLITAYVLSMLYLGILGPLLQLQVSISSLVVAPILGYIALGYHYLRESLEKLRELREAAAEQE